MPCAILLLISAKALSLSPLLSFSCFFSKVKLNPKPARNAEGHLQLQRAYDFEFSDIGDNRLKGSVVTLGRRVTLLNLGLRPEPTITTTLH